MDSETKKQLIAYLMQRVTENKRAKMETIIKDRTRHVSIVLEDIFQAHNANAIIRSAECFGIQDVHLIEEKNTFKVTSGIAMGSAKWVTTHRYKTTADCFTSLKENGYRIVATTPHTKACYLEDLPLDKKLVLVFGTEHDGLSEYALQHADEFVKIPMVGFTESFNVSVSAGISLYHIMNALRKISIDWRLTEEEKLDVMLAWLRKSIRGSKEFEQQFLHNSLSSNK